MGFRSEPSPALEPAHQHALELLADRWNMWLLLAVREQGGSRFSDLAGEPGLSRRVLSERLERLVERQLLERRQYQARPPRHRYALTERGLAVRRVCFALLHVATGGHIAPAAPEDRLPTPHAIPAAPEPAATTSSIAAPELADHPSDRLLEGDPDAARAIYDQAVAPLVRYDEQYRTPLVQTLEAYLACDASVSVTAARLYAHRHTVRYRLGRIRELTGLDVDSLADRERLVLGLRAMRLIRRGGRLD